MAPGDLELIVLLSAALGFFNHINVQFGTVSEMCTHATCPTMTAGKE